ncbi:MAG TPA: tRNA (uridine(34)/cytosine(34)/5-carboxymethylaminomethyluridine(34)-2'-O)-methyltransferase TrmL [Chromatiaceae bacterium]|jgi:tRNA (cytidine/uridine-2'-O-)-methyltransferase|nr:tRNA (uridine(34)/cytosine(34)/5-carboxymethylaminomethyluridine(34)-2'-O)-methyltransferase TrmL [Chromatiaceae bacterium]HIN81576.1 tRNA (uridine(34)/cytosine(34)/5-carboxymethylaminomethyluridine(34)-2'-O)-methyltransferase TrmL [Chromatiales bacterium]HIA07819.1 tRNA (uridine(34)/cytosine(34)/5-carboxymethylaminomethyluridine(34)-2'-O)-methyltransferase TrmL [Chromatiaceae bacterium]HIB83785.1 tRNA (uridine(34)/cytosine(34)/5-carboxymethylaminomethyluridine(34)-2'-O)-methyltransferase Trm
MFHVVLFEPEIPPNTGNIIRLCANTGSRLHLIEPLGFDLDEKSVRRAGLDYHDMACVERHASFSDFLVTAAPLRLFALSTRGRRNYAEVKYQAGDALLFGPETRGLPQTLLDTLQPEQVLRIPMQAGNRSLNLSNVAALVVYEGWRQNNFAMS